MENGELDEFADTLGISCVQSASYLEVSYGGGSAYVPENSLNSDSRIFFEMDNTPGKYFRSGDAKRVCGGTVPRRYSGRIIPYNDNESYPSEIGKLLNFLQENMVELMENNQSTVQRLGVLTIQVLAVIPTSNSALEQLLEEHGWNNKELRYEYSVVGSGNSGIDYDSLSQALGTLYLAHLAQSEEQPEEGASSRIRGRTSSTIAFDDIELKAKRSLLQPDYLYYSYAPSILFKIIATMFDEDPSRDMAREADVVPFALDENGSGDEGSIFQLKPTKSFFCNKSLSFGDSDVSNPPSGSMSEHIRKSMSNAIFNANLPKPELSCRETDFMGACLLADISGFTKLSASFCKNGSIGLDKLHQATNGLLGNFVRIVYKHHGDVIAFAGDALICVFPVTESGVNSNSGMKQMCQFAVMCASELVGVHTSDLTSHIGISCGPMSMAILGGHDNKWVYLMNGACISELSSCIDDAGPGEVVVTEDVYKIISDDDINAIPGSELVVANLMKESGNYKVIHLSSNFGKYFEFSGNRYDGLNLTTNITSAVRLFVPRTVEYGISSGTFLSMSELREVTTLFLKLDTYDSVKNRSPMTLQPFFQMAQKEVANMGGFMRQFLIDDKGCVLIAMWGVPSCSHPNNAARAVACGIRIHGSIAMYHHSCSIGITTGHVFCGNIGSLVRRDFVGIGADVNLAARLMAKAKGLIFVDQRSHNLLPLQFRRNMTKSDGLVLKGVADTTFAYICDGSMDHRLLTEKTSNFFSIPKHIASIVQSEVLKVAKGGAMETGLSRSRNKMSSVIEQKITASIILVEGPSGSGKSSVTALLRRLARNEKLRVVYIEGRQRDRNVRHGIARKIFISLVGSKYFETEQQQRFILDELVTSFHKKTDKLGFKAQLQVLAVSLGLEWNDEVSEEESGPLRYFVSPLASRASSARNRNWRQPSGHLDAGVQTGKFNSASKDSYSDATVSDLVVERSDSICNTKDTLEQTIDLQEIILNKALKILLERETTVIVIDDMHFADECSWNQLRMLMDFNSSLLIAISVRQHHASQDKVNHSEKSVSSSNRPPSSPHSRLPFFNSAPNRSDTSAKYEMGIGTASGNASPTKAGGQSKLQSSPAFEALCELRNATKIEMLPLSSKESKKFISQVLQESDVLSAEVMENVMKLTSGNIYLLKETANFIMERGIDAFMDACKCSTTSPLRVFIVSRLEKLSFEQQSVLKYASLIGEEFSWSLINHMIPPQFRRNLERTLDSLINHGFIFVVVNEPLTFSFVDPTKRMILYGLTPDSESVKIHSAIGNAIETIYASNLAPWYSSLAYHYALGEGTRAKAFNFCLLAAEEACAKEAYADALLFCMNAQSIAINRTEMRLELNTVHQIIADMEIVKSSKNQQLKTGNPYLDLLSSMVAGSGLSFMSNKESNMNKKILQNIFEAFCNLRDSLENDIQQATRRYNDDSKLSVSGFPSFYRSKSSVYEADNGEPSFTARCDTSYGGGPGPNGGTGLPFSPPAVTTEAFSSASLSQNCRKQWDPSVLSATALAIATSPTGHGVSIFSQANAISTSGGNASPKKSSAHSIAQGLTNLIKNSTDIIRRGRSRGGSVCSEDDDEGNCAASRSGSNSRSRSGSGASATKSKPIPVPLSNAMRGGRNSPSIYRSDSCAASPALSSQSGSPAVVDVGDSWSCLKTPSPLPNSPPKGASVYPF